MINLAEPGVYRAAIATQEKMRANNRTEPTLVFSDDMVKDVITGGGIFTDVINMVGDIISQPRPPKNPPPPSTPKNYGFQLRGSGGRRGGRRKRGSRGGRRSCRGGSVTGYLLEDLVSAIPAGINLIKTAANGSRKPARSNRGGGTYNGR